MSPYSPAVRNDQSGWGGRTSPSEERRQLLELTRIGNTPPPPCVGAVPPLPRAEVGRQGTGPCAAGVGRRRAGQSRRLLLGGARGDIVRRGGRRRSCSHAGVAGSVGGAAAASRERRDRAAARGRRGAHPAAVPAVPGADAGAGDPERAPQRLHVVLDPLALLAQLGHGAGPLPLPGPFGLDGRGARHPPGRGGVGGSRQRTGPWN